MMSSKAAFPCSVEQSADGARRLVATRDVEEGELLLIEEPIVFTSGPLEKNGSLLAWKLVDHLLAQNEARRWFLQIGFKLTQQGWDSYDDERSIRTAIRFGTDLSAIRDLYFRVATNHLGYYDAHSNIPAGSALYETLCFSNHSCAPNSAPAKVPVAFRHAALVAIGRIKSGEEITWSYMGFRSLAASYNERHDMLRAQFGFDCRCRRCIHAL